MINGPLPLRKSILEGVHNGNHQFNLNHFFLLLLLLLITLQMSSFNT